MKIMSLVAPCKEPYFLIKHDKKADYNVFFMKNLCLRPFFYSYFWLTHFIIYAHNFVDGVLCKKYVWTIQTY